MHTIQSITPVLLHMVRISRKTLFRKYSYYKSVYSNIHKKCTYSTIESTKMFRAVKMHFKSITIYVTVLFSNRNDIWTQFAIKLYTMAFMSSTLQIIYHVTCASLHNSFNLHKLYTEAFSCMVKSKIQSILLFTLLYQLFNI